MNEDDMFDYDAYNDRDNGLKWNEEWDPSDISRQLKMSEPCPYCKSRSLSMAEPYKDAFAVSCDDCGVMGPLYPNYIDVFQSWDAMPRRKS